MSKQPKEPSDRVELRKSSADAPDLDDERPAVRIPKAINIVLIAIAAEIVFNFARALLVRGYTSELVELLKKSNADAKHPKKPYTATEIAHDLDQFRSGTLIQAIILGVLLVVLGYMLTKRRTASASRWGLIAILVLMRIPFAVIPVSGLPVLPQAAGVLMGAASIVVIVGLLVPPSMQYFREIRNLNRPAGVPARPGLGSLFGPRPPRRSARDAEPTAPAASATQAAPSKPNGSATPPRRGKAKVRADQAAVERGAELARTRAKASKSRRSE